MGLFKKLLSRHDSSEYDMTCPECKTMVKPKNVGGWNYKYICHKCRRSWKENWKPEIADFTTRGHGGNYFK